MHPPSLQRPPRGPPAGPWKVAPPPHGPIVFACRKPRPRPPIWPTGSSAWQTCRGTFIWPKKRAIRAWGSTPATSRRTRWPAMAPPGWVPGAGVWGDINIAHQTIDLKNWRSNQKNSGFLPEERLWMTNLLDVNDKNGVLDVYRRLQRCATDTAYTWWSNRGRAYANNVGWRLDYHLATPALAALARAQSIYKGEKFSDHAPITVDYELRL